MTRQTALKTFFALLASRAVAQTASLTLDIEKRNETLRYVFAAKKLTLEIDGRTVTFTAKELADALDAK